MGRVGTVEVDVREAEITIVTLRGEHDLATATAIGVALAVAAGAPSTLVDLSPATFIDSTVISTLLRAACSVQRRSGVLEIVACCGSAPRRVLDLAGMPQIIPVHAGVSEGLASIASCRTKWADRSQLRAMASRMDTLGAEAFEARSGRTDVGDANIGVVRP